MTKYFGKEGRAEAREREFKIANDKANKLFEHTIGKEIESLTQHDFEVQWNIIIAQLSEICKSIRVYKRIHNILVKRACKILEMKGFISASLTFLYTHKDYPPLRTYNWIRNAWNIDNFHSEWLTKLGKENTLTLPQQVYQALMLSFICHSGHADVSLVKAFNQILNCDEINIINYFSLPCVVLTFSSKKHLGNDYDHDQQITVRNCYLSYITYALLQKWLKIDKKNWRHPLNPNDIYHKMVGPYLLKEYDLPSDLFRFCESAIYVTQQLTEVKMNEALVHFSIGRLRSYSLPHANQANLLKNKVNNGKEHQFYVDTFAPGKRKNIESNKNCHLPTSGIYEQLKTLIKDFKQSMKSSKSLKKELEIISEKPLALFEKVFVLWLILKTKTCSPQSIYIYFSILGRSWFKIAGTENFFAMEIGEIEELYSEEIESKKTSKSQTDFIYHLKYIHLLLVRLNILPRFEGGSVLGGTSNNYVRSGFIDESLFRAFLDSCDFINDVNDQDKVALKAMSIVSYRGGLRLTEVRKLMLDDIENSSDGWLYIRSNKYAKNKSESSERKIPLYILLLPNEVEIIKEHLQNKGASLKSHNQLLFTLGSQVNDMIPGFLISNYVSRRLRAISGCEHFVFHHLRHTSLSRLQLMLELSSKSNMLENIVPYDARRSKRIIEKICGLNEKNKYEGLAKFAGHQSPVTTFKHYFHFNDLILGYRCSELNILLSVKQAQALGLASRRVCKSFFSKSDDLLKSHYFKDYLFKKYKLALPLIYKETPAEIQVIKVENKKPPSTDLCYSVLSKIVEGYGIESIAFEFGLEIEKVSYWVKSACYIRDKYIISLQKRPEFVDFNSYQRLLPGNLKRLAEQKTLDKLRLAMSQFFNDKKALYKRIILYVIQNISSAHSGILFNSASDLAWFLESLEPVIPKSNWRSITYRIEYSPNLRSWNKALSGIITEVGIKASNKGRIGKGTIRLEYICPEESSLISGTNLSKYSSHLFTYLIHIQCIMMKGLFSDLHTSETSTRLNLNSI